MIIHYVSYFIGSVNLKLLVEFLVLVQDHLFLIISE